MSVASRLDPDRAVCDIIVRSYYRDFPWLRYCLRSIERFARGFRRTILVVPAASASRLRPGDPGAAEIVVCADYGDDYLGQQITKLWADTVTDADLICHVDSDCIFYRPFGPRDLLRDGKIELWHTPYGELPDDVGWQQVTQRLLKTPIESNFMRRQPMAFPRWIYGAFRERIGQLHGTDMTSYVVAQEPRGFSEYNALGAFAYAHYRERFSWTRVAADAPNEQLCKWYWSWGGISAATRCEIEALLCDAPSAR